MIITQFTNLQIIWIPGKKLAFPDLLTRNLSLKDLNGHQLAHIEIPKDISFFNQSGHDVQYLIDQNSSADDGNDDFYPIVCTQLGETKAFHLNNDGTEMICTIFDSKSPKPLFIVSDSFREGKNINNIRKWQAPAMLVEAEVHEVSYSEIESDSEVSEDEASDVDLALGQEIQESRKTNLYSTPSNFSYMNQTEH